MGLNRDALRAKRGAVPAHVVAEQILWLRGEMEQKTTPFQLQKLIYIAHGWMLGEQERPLVSDEVRAWEYGPVFLEVYHRYKKFGGSPITEPTANRAHFLTDGQRRMIDKVVREYNLPFADLYSIVHHESTPWSKIWKEKGRNAVIPNHIIQEHYQWLMEQGVNLG